VRLTDAEIQQCSNSSQRATLDKTFWAFTRAIEAAVIAKNSGGAR